MMCFAFTYRFLDCCILIFLCIVLVSKLLINIYQHLSSNLEEYSKTHIKRRGRLLILANLKTSASYLDPQFIDFGNFGVASNLSGSSFRRCE